MSSDSSHPDADPPPVSPQRDPGDGPPTVDPHSVEGIFLAALREDDPLAFVESNYPATDVRDRVRALLLAYDDAGSFLDAPIGGKRADPPPLDFLASTDRPELLGTLDDYEIQEIVGWGGMGVVLRAQDVVLQRVVAIKVLQHHLATQPAARQRFLREARAAAAVSHPHVVTIHAVAEGRPDEGTPPYLVMEFVAGRTLADKLRKSGPLAVPEILRISRQLAEGLAAAHAQGLVHRDIKPANILLENGVERVKISDFGLARAVDDVSVTRTGEVAGTPTYMSPEQARGEPLDHRSDLFSLGCVLFAMCTGHSPFRGERLAHVIQRVTQDTPRSVREVNPEIPAGLADLIAQLLCKQPAERPSSASLVAERLDEQLRRHQTGTAPAPKPATPSAPRPDLAGGTPDQPAVKQGRSGEAAHALRGRVFIYLGVVLVLLPWIPWTLSLMTQSTPLVGGILLMPLQYLGAVFLALGILFRYGFSEASRRKPLRLWIPLLAVMAILGILALWPDDGPETTDRSPVIAPVQDPIHPQLTVAHPELKLRYAMVAGLPCSKQQIDPTHTRLLLRDRHLGQRVPIRLIAQDGSECYLHGMAIERARDTVTTSVQDWSRAGRTLLEVIDDAADDELRLVTIPAPSLANGTYDVHEAPFHFLLSPGQTLELQLVYLPTDAPASPEPEHFGELRHRFTVPTQEHVQLSFQDLLDAARAK